MTGAGRPLREVGEEELIEQIARLVGDRSNRVSIGIGDDAAAWRPRAGHELVITTDTLIERVHFRLEWTDWEALGHKSLAVNLSDIAAMGAIPRLAVVDLAVRGTERDRDIADFYRGVQALARRFGVAIVGGDTTRSPLGVAVSITVIGESPRDGHRLLRRDAGRPGDLIGVTGPIGLAAAGLRVLERGLKTLDGNPVMQEHYHRPQPRVREGLLLRRCGVRAAMDISDGLLGDLQKLCRASGVAAIVDLERVRYRTRSSGRFRTGKRWRSAEATTMNCSSPLPRLCSHASHALSPVQGSFPRGKSVNSSKRDRPGRSSSCGT
jgi:thiamine-monophosphate kinase